MNNNQSNAASLPLVVKQVRQAFVAELLSGREQHTIPFGGSLMPRKVWAEKLMMALALEGLISPEASDAIAAVLNSDLGNSSQLGANLKDEGVVVLESKEEAASSYAELLKQRIAAKAPQA